METPPRKRTLESVKEYFWDFFKIIFVLTTSAKVQSLAPVEKQETIIKLNVCNVVGKFCKETPGLKKT